MSSGPDMTAPAAAAVASPSPSTRVAMDIVRALRFGGVIALIGLLLTPWLVWLGIAFTLFSVAYGEMARRVTTAGGIYSYMSYGFGRIIGLGAHRVRAGGRSLE